MADNDWGYTCENGKFSLIARLRLELDTPRPLIFADRFVYLHVYIDARDPELNKTPVFANDFNRQGTVTKIIIVFRYMLRF